MADLLSDVDVGFGAAPKLLSDADVGFAPPKEAQPQTGASSAPSTESYGFDVPGGGAAQPKISESIAPTPPASLEVAQNQASNRTSIADVPARIGRALIEGWKNAPDILTPQAQDWLANAERNNPRPNLQDVLTVGHAALAAGSAAFKGGLEGIAALGEVVGAPQLGRDVAGYYEAMGTTGAPHFPAVLRSTLPQTLAALTEQRLAAGKGQSGVADIMGAGNVDDAIAAASRASAEPAAIAAPPTPDAASIYREAPNAIPPNAKPPVLPRILDLLNEDARVAANRPDFIPPDAAQPPVAMGSVPTPEATPELESVGAAASREGTAPGLIAMSPEDAAANRAQGEVERFAAPPSPNDKTIYIPGTKPTLAEVTGDPRDAMDQAYNRQQPEAMQAHTEQENHNAEAVADYYADTAGSAQTLLRMERARDDRAQQNIQRVFGDPQSERPPADPTDVIQFMDETLADPRMQERDIIRKTLPNLIDRFYNEDGSVKTDPLSLYGIRQHIQDLLNGAGDPETNAAARMLRRELMQIQSRLDDVIEQAAPGFAQYRADYTSDSREIDAMKLLQGERLPLLNKDLHITPAKWFSFMKGLIEGRNDPMDPASALSEDQMDRLWNITDQLKRQTFIDAGKPRGSWTSMMQEWGGRFARVAAHGIAISAFPVVGNLGVEMGVAGLRRRNVNKEMNRVLNPDLGQSAQP